MNNLHGTTIIGVRKNGKVTIAGDGQVSLGNTVIKGTAKKIRLISNEGFKVISGFAGSTADAFTLIERLEKKLENFPSQLSKACVELAKDWRTDKYLRNLEAMMIVSDGTELLIITGSGDVLEPENNIAAVGSGGSFALAAARALYDQKISSEKIALKSLKVASEICVFTNNNITYETLGEKSD
jgi:ATP-dependent HslUV protease subunit HslV